MAASEIKHVIITCDKDGCRDGVRIKVAGIARARRAARSHHGWEVLEGRDICFKHVPVVMREIAKRKEQDASS